MYHTLHMRCCRPDLVIGIFLSFGLSCKWNMKPLWKVKGFEQYTSWNVHEICTKTNIFIYTCIYILIFTVILRAVARDMLCVTRIIGGFVPVLFSTDQLSNLSGFLVQSLSSLFPSSLFSFVSLFISVSLRLFHLFFSSLRFCAVACSVLCCCVLLVSLCCVCVLVCVCRCVMCLEFNSVFRCSE